MKCLHWVGGKKERLANKQLQHLTILVPEPLNLCPFLMSVMLVAMDLYARELPSSFLWLCHGASSHARVAIGGSSQRSRSSGAFPLGQAMSASTLARTLSLAPLSLGPWPLESKCCPLWSYHWSWVMSHYYISNKETTPSSNHEKLWQFQPEMGISLVILGGFQCSRSQQSIKHCQARLFEPCLAQCRTSVASGPTPGMEVPFGSALPFGWWGEKNILLLLVLFAQVEGGLNILLDVVSSLNCCSLWTLGIHGHLPWPSLVDEAISPVARISARSQATV